jgi:hypothetical protein
MVDFLKLLRAKAQYLQLFKSRSLGRGTRFVPSPVETLIGRQLLAGC